jgi:hypothetical protein
MLPEPATTLTADCKARLVAGALSSGVAMLTIRLATNPATVRDAEWTAACPMPANLAFIRSALITASATVVIVLIDAGTSAADLPSYCAVIAARGAVVVCGWIDADIPAADLSSCCTVISARAAIVVCGWIDAGTSAADLSSYCAVIAARAAVVVCGWISAQAVAEYFVDVVADTYPIAFVTMLVRRAHKALAATVLIALAVQAETEAVIFAAHLTRKMISKRGSAQHGVIQAAPDEIGGEAAALHSVGATRRNRIT